MNKVIISGRLGGDPEFKRINNDFAVAEMSLAVHKRQRTPEGEWVDTVNWFSVLARGKIAERVQKVLCKGCGVLVEGSLRLEEWDDKQTGKKCSRVLVEMWDFEPLGGGRTREGSQEREEGRREYSQERPPQRKPQGQQRGGNGGSGRYSRRDEGEYYGDYEQQY